MRRDLILSDKRLMAGTILIAAITLITHAAAKGDAPGSKPAPAGKLPPLATVKATVERTLAVDRNYRPGDLITQRQVGTVLDELKTAGWDVEQDRKLLARVPSDNEFLVRALRTPRGTSFMRQLAAMPGGYDRVDRLSRIPNGQQTVQKLIDGPDGHKLVGYLTEARGGKELGGMLSGTAGGADFNEATGRIYTAAQLLAELEKLHAAAAKQAGQ